MIHRIMNFFARASSAPSALQDRDAAHDQIRQSHRPPRTYHGEEALIREIEEEHRQARRRLEGLVLNRER